MKRRKFITQSSLLGTAAALSPAGLLQARRGPSQRITVGQAMKICTVNGAYASMEENIKGSITPGKLADLVVLAADQIKNIPVLRTIVDGKTVYEA